MLCLRCLGRVDTGRRMHLDRRCWPCGQRPLERRWDMGVVQQPHSVRETNLAGEVAMTDHHEECSCNFFDPKNIKVTAIRHLALFVDYCPLPSQIIYIPHGHQHAIIPGIPGEFGETRYDRVELRRYFFRVDGQFWEQWLGYHPETNTIVMSPLSLARKLTRRPRSPSTSRAGTPRAGRAPSR